MGEALPVEQSAAKDETSADSRDAGEHDEAVYVCRIALAFLRLPAGTDWMFTSPEARKLSVDAQRRLSDALIADSRVVELIDQDNSETLNARTYTMWDSSKLSEDLLEVVEGYQALRLNDPVVFRIRVPRKNQPLYRGRNDVPADSYLALYDGINIYIQWFQDDRRVTASGGHIVFEILEDAARQAGFGLDIRACSAECHHLFVHADFITVAQGEPDHLTRGGDTPVGVTMVNPFPHLYDEVPNLRRTRDALATPMLNYAEVRNDAEVIAYLYSKAIHDSSEVMDLSYRRASRKPLWSVRGWYELWQLRGSGRRTRLLIAGLWYAVSSITTRRRTWRTKRDHMLRLLAQTETGALRTALDQDISHVESYDLDVIRTSLADTTNQLNSRALLIATLAGAIAVLAGAALTLLLA